jgi:hypothetical protein
LFVTHYRINRPTLIVTMAPLTIKTPPMAPGNSGSRWEDQKSKLKLSFPKLTDADLNFDESEKFEMLTQLQSKVGRTVQELKVIIETL